MNAFDTLPTGIQFPKPMRYPNLDEMRDLHAAGKLFIQRKRDGQRHVIHVTADGVKMFDRNLRQIFHFTSILKAFEGFNLPAGTLVDGEVIVEHANGADDFSTISSLNKAGLEKAIALAAKTRPTFMVFDLLFCAGEPTYSQPYSVRHETIQSFNGCSDVVYTVPNMDCTVDEAVAQSIENGWEGLVFWHKDRANKIGFGSQAPRLNSWKWKATRESDFICTGWEPTTAEPGAPMYGVAGALNLFENRNGKMVSVGGVGTGLTLKERAEATTWTYPCVVEVVYDERTPTKALRFPRFVRMRTDKTVGEVFADNSERITFQGSKSYSPRGHKG